jgi:hypothetical protein
MKRGLLKNSKLIASLALNFALLSGCGGGGSNNDQGTAFALIGFNGVDQQGVCDPNLFVNSFTIRLSGERGGRAPETVGSGQQLTCLTVQNLMSTQRISTERVVYEFNIPGAVEQPPVTSVAMAQVFGPQVVTQPQPVGGIAGNQPSSSLPNVVQAQQGQLSLPVVPLEVMKWLYLNQSKYPELPINLTGTVRIFGVTSSGDVIESNPSSFSLQLLPELAITDDAPLVNREESSSSLESNGSPSPSFPSPSEGTPPSEEPAKENENADLFNL